MSKPVFYDPDRKRWKRLRLLINVAGVISTVLVVFFAISLSRDADIPNLLLPEEKRPYHQLREKERRHINRSTAHRRKPGSKASELVLNSGEPVRAAFYVQWDAGSYASLREYGHQIDLLFPEFLHVLTPDGHLQGVTDDNRIFDVLQGTKVTPVDTKVMNFLRSEKLPVEVFPLVNNYNPINKEWVASIGKMLSSAAARQHFRDQMAAFLSSDTYRGLTLDFEEIPTPAQPGFRALIAELAADLHARGMKLYVAVPADNSDFDYRYIAATSDGAIVMNYDQHFPEGAPGAIAGQEWFVRNLQHALKVMPREKLICAIASYGYDWPRKKAPDETVENLSVQGAWLTARESEAYIDFHSDSLNPHFEYADGHNIRHDVWFTDAVTALNEMRAARNLGINTFALWRLGSEDRSLWNVWDHPSDANAANELRSVPPGRDVDLEGQGEIVRITDRPSPGTRTVSEDAQTHLIDDEEYTDLPTPYQLARYGAHAKQIAITFDDGPDPQWTPKVLDILKREHVPATFFLIGSQADKYTGLLDRIYREGHEIGNHTWSHPDISAISKRYMRFELNATERLFEAKLGIKPVYFRPPYSIDEEPDTDDEVRPLEVMQEMGYLGIGSQLDPGDWQEEPKRPTAEELVANIFANLPPCSDLNHHCGNVLLLHDGGGDRRETVRALPMIISGLRARGYQLVPVSALIGKTRAEVMPPIAANERWSARLDRVGFWIWGAMRNTIVAIFFIGDALMTLRMFIIGSLAIFDRFHKRRQPKTAVPANNDLGPGYFEPAVAVLIPAYNEEKVIERTVRAALRSDYAQLRVIVIDDGSKDRTLEIVTEAFHDEVAAGRVLILTKPNSGKAHALNFGLEHVNEEIFVGIDADTVIAPGAVSKLVPHFVDARVAAVAGNAKVGNRVNLWTRWQALEYVTSQNFERRALNTLGAVSVVPGALGAWRTQLVRESGGYHVDTVAEDADLTMSLLERGYRVEYEDRALAFTEAPISANGLMRQRFRWSFGILQSVWKHRGVFARKGVLGMVALPNIVIFQILLPLVSPFIDIMFAVGALSYAADRYFHPESADASSFEKLLLFFLTFLIIDFVTSAIAFALERRDADHREDIWLLGDIWLQRFTYRQLFSVVLFKTLKRAIDGRSFAWDKLERTARLTYADQHQRPEPVGKA